MIRNGFLPEEADYNFWNLLAYCSYEGETLERYIVGRVSNDNDDYSTHIKSNDIFDGNSSHWSASEFNNEKYHVYLTFYRLIEGLAMPYDIAFGDSIDGVLEKLSCSKEPWVAGENAWTMTLSQTKEVNTNGIVLVHQKCNLQLGTNAVGTGNKYGLGDTGKIQIEQTAEPSDIGANTLGHSSGDAGLHQLYRLIACGNIYACVLIAFAKTLLVHNRILSSCRQFISYLFRSASDQSGRYGFPWGLRWDILR